MPEFIAVDARIGRLPGYYIMTDATLIDRLDSIFPENRNYSGLKNQEAIVHFHQKLGRTH